MMKWFLGLAFCFIFQAQAATLEQQIQVRQEQIEQQVIESTGQHYKEYLESKNHKKASDKKGIESPKDSLKSFMWSVLAVVLLLLFVWLIFRLLNKDDNETSEISFLSHENDSGASDFVLEEEIASKSKISRLFSEGLAFMLQNQFSDARDKFSQMFRYELNADEEFDVYYYIGVAYAQDFYEANNLKSHTDNMSAASQKELLLKAEDHLRHTVELNKESPDAAFALGVVEKRLGRNYYQNTLQLAKDLFEAKNKTSAVLEVDELMK